MSVVAASTNSVPNGVGKNKQELRATELRFMTVT